MAAYVLIVVVAALGFYRFEQITARNSVIVDCVTEWVAQNTGALQDRDAVNRTALAAEMELWRDLHDYLSVPQEGRRTLLRDIKEYRVILSRLSAQQSINPYPDIRKCLGADGLSLASAATGKKCFGRRPTIFGTKGDDTIHGTDGRDVIRAGPGDDLIVAGHGKDLICGGRGADMINGGQHFDKARGGYGKDFCVLVEHTSSCR